MEMNNQICDGRSLFGQGIHTMDCQDLDRCEECGTELEEALVPVDYFDPLSFNGHGQTMGVVGVCPSCENLASILEMEQEAQYEAE